MKKIFLLLALFYCYHLQAQLQRFSFSRPKMGSPFTVIFYATDSLQAHLYADACYKVVDSLNAILSDYDPQSEINRLTETKTIHEWIAISPALLDVLQKASIAYGESSGSVDVTVGPLSKLWRQARKTNRFAEKKKVQEAKKSVGFKKIVLDTINHRVKFLEADMQLDFGAIAKGYIAQKVIDHLLVHKIDKALVDAGGDIALSGPPPGKQGWNVGVNIPESEDLLSQKIVLANKAIATSGDLYQYIEKDGNKYSHIIDPATGYGVLHRKNITVIADDGAQADWLATACSILNTKKARKLVRRQHASLLVAEWKNGKVILHSVNGFNEYFERGSK